MAASKEPWDFECPQFVDFMSELDKSSKEDVFFDDSNMLSSPVVRKEIKSHKEPGDPVTKNILTEDAEMKLMDKMVAALTLIENTPKLPQVKKHYSERDTVKHPISYVVKTTGKRKTIQPNKLHRSQSVISLNKIITDKQNNKIKPLRKRSSSLSDLRPTKKHTYPLTPMCLKRTIFKAKAKIKTTEEMELEEIAKLQKQLIQHLRYNEISLKKLKLKPARAHITTQKNTQNVQTKTEKSKEDKVVEKGLNPYIEKLSQKETRRNFQMLTHEAVKVETLKSDSIINNKGPSNKGTEKTAKDVKSKNPSVASSFASEASEKDKAQACKKSISTKKYGFHSGLLFHDNNKKYTVVKPFSFDAKIKGMKSQNSESNQNAEAWLSSSKLVSKVDDCKENMLYKSQLHSDVEKVKGILNAKCDINVLGSTKKMVGKHMGNQMRGLPLSENFARKNL